MTSNHEKAIKTRVSKVIRAARKSAGLTQTQVSAALGLTQGAISKFEAGYLLPPMLFWYDFCKLTNISSEEAFQTGYIDRRSELRVDNHPRVGTFKIPRKYSFDCGSTVRVSRPLIAFFRSKYGENAFNKYLQSLKIDPDYFVIQDHSLNIQFNLDLIRLLIKKGDLKLHHLDRLVWQLSRPEMHAGLHSLYDLAENTKQLLMLLLRNSLRYEANFKYEIENESRGGMDISITPNGHMVKFDYRGSDLGTFICDYNKRYFIAFSAYGNRIPVTLTERECHFQGHDRCLYQIRMAG